MAQCEGKCFLVRRFADRGIEKNIGDSRVHGEDRHPTRRVADRGSGGVYLDPGDLKIKRLQQRVRDLEEIRRLRQRVPDLEEIRRLRQRVQDLEVQQEMSKAETESSTVVWDEGDDGEEHPFEHHPPRFLEPIYEDEFGQECFLVDEPRFDEDVIEPDEEECLFIQMTLSGTTIQENEHTKEAGGKDHE
ncbi:hypothetical protein Hdeb2414_s0004g00143001 [Helianthus debilis subsp. tardiflorus]